MTARTATRHIGLDLGGTNLKWAVVERSGEAWMTVDRGQVPTPRRPSGARPRSCPSSRRSRTGDPDRLGARRQRGHRRARAVRPGRGHDPVPAQRAGPWAGRPWPVPWPRRPGVPALLINDARAFGLAELRLGRGQWRPLDGGLTLGTGVGGVFAVDGRVHLGHDGTAGELGHQTIDPDGPWCNCGNRGCIEAYARADQIAAACGTATAEEAMARARAGDARAIAGLRGGRALPGHRHRQLVVIISPDRIVVGRRRRGGRRPAVRAHPRRGPAAGHDHLARRRDALAAELGTWAGSIGAAVHGAEQAGATLMTARIASLRRATARSSWRCASASRRCGRATGCRRTATCAGSSGSAG